MIGALTTLVTFLSTIGVVISAVLGYLIINKLWKRRHDRDVVESISVASISLAAFVYLCMAIKFGLFDHAYLFALQSSVDGGAMIMVLLIGIGFWLRANRRVGILRLAMQAFRLERKESLDLLKLLVNPTRADKLLDILVKLAAVDHQLAEEEIRMINRVAAHWNLKTPNLTAETVTEPVSLAELRESTIAYLDVSPPIEQAAHLLDLLQVMVKADATVSPEEEIILEELSSLIGQYIDGDTATTVMFEVVVVPQNERQVESVITLFPNTKAVTRCGSKAVYVAGKFCSEKYAADKADSYQQLGLYATVHQITDDDD